MDREEVQIQFLGPAGEKAHVIAGLDGTPRTFSLTLNGEPFWVGGSARLALDEDHRLVLKISLSYLETPSTQELKYIFYEDDERNGEGCVLLRFRETPDAAVAGKMLSDLFTGEDANQAALREKIRNGVRRLFEPKLKGSLIEEPSNPVSEKSEQEAGIPVEPPGPAPLPSQE